MKRNKIIERLRSGEIHLSRKTDGQSAWFYPGDMTNGGVWLSNGFSHKFFVDDSELLNVWEVQ